MMMKNGSSTFPGALAGALAVAVLLAVPFAPGVARAERFSHKVHQEQGAGECRDCHKPGALSIIPQQAVCLPCHQAKELADTPLGPSKTHTAFWLLQHGDESTAPGAQCRSCHASSFCVDCHAGGEIGVDLRKQAGKLNIPPRPHTPGFRVTHPLKAEGLGARACEQCHKREFCTDCHARSVPAGTKLSSHKKNAEMGGPLHQGFTVEQCQGCHPGGALSSRDWSAGHAQEARRNLSSCRNCHPDGDPCVRCHSAKSGLKVSPHPGNWRQIQKKFRQESPKVCEKCHSAGGI